MVNWASRIGEAVGHAVEARVQEVVREVVAPYGLYVDIGGPRPGRRKTMKLRLKNAQGIDYQIDTVVEDQSHNPLILIECKYLRYKKHNRDKASWTCVAHYRLRTTYPTVKKSIAVLIGNWSQPSLLLMQSFGVDTIVIPFEQIALALGNRGIAFDWDEKDSEIPQRSWQVFDSLSAEEKSAVVHDCVAQHEGYIRKSVLDAVEMDPNSKKHIEQIELLLRTSQQEYFVRRFSSVRDSLSFLANLTADRDDLGEFL